MKIARFFSCALLVFSPVALVGQEVSDLTISETQVVLEIGDRLELFLDAADSLGDFVEITVAQWTSSNDNVVTVELDLDVPGIATLVAQAAGTAEIEARVRGATASVSVRVNGGPQVSTPGSILALHTVRLAGARFNSPRECSAGIMTNRPGLILTTYSAIRGVEQLTVQNGTGASLGTVEVAAYDVAQNLAVLRISGPMAQGLTPSGSPNRGALVNATSFPGCRASEDGQVTVGNTAADGATFALAGDLGAEYLGSALVDSNGQLVGLVTGSNTGTAGNPLNEILTAAETAPISQTVTQVATQEGHLYGAIDLSSPVSGGTARITPSETTAWPEIATEQTLPFTFRGPTGFYTAELLVDGEFVSSRLLRVQQGITTRESLTEPLPFAQGPAENQAQPDQRPNTPANQPPETVKGGGGFPIPVLIVAVLGGGIAALLAGGGDPGGDPGGGGGGTGGSGTGGITIAIPIP